jgi:hypothetical protein
MRNIYSALRDVRPQRITLTNFLANFRLGYSRALWRAITSFAVTLAFGLFQATHAAVTYYYASGPFSGLADDNQFVGCVSGAYTCVTTGDITATLTVNNSGGITLAASALGLSLSSASNNTAYQASISPLFFTIVPLDHSAVINDAFAIVANPPGSPTSLTVGVASSPGVLTTTTPSCSQILAGAVTTPVLGEPLSTNGQPTSIDAKFTPNYGMTLREAATTCNVLGFDWQQTIEVMPSPSPYTDFTQLAPLTAPPPFNDPPLLGYANTQAECSTNPPTYSTAFQDAYPFYYNPLGPSSDCMSLSSPTVTLQRSIFLTPRRILA